MSSSSLLAQPSTSSRIKHQTYSNPSKKRASSTRSPFSYPPSAYSTSSPLSSNPSLPASTSNHPATSSSSSSSCTRPAPKKRASPRLSTSSLEPKLPSPPPPETTTEPESQPSLRAKIMEGLGSAGDERPKSHRVLFEDEYRDDVVKYMHQMERSTLPNLALMDAQPELKWYMRPYLVEFLVEIHQQFRLRPEVLYLALNVVDRYVSKRIVFKKHYQLVGCAALWIAAKFEDSKDKIPLVEQLREMCCNAYDESAFLQMEGHVLSTIGWVVGHPTAESWLRLACMGTSEEDAETQHVARFIMELSLFYKEFCSFLPSAIAGGALILARWVLGKPPRMIDQKSSSVQVAFHLDAHLGEHLSSISEVLIVKYSHFYYNRASLVVRQEYLQGRRFTLQLAPQTTPPTTTGRPTQLVIPTMPSLSRSTSEGSINGMRRSSSTWSSDSDMPLTPTATGTPELATVPLKVTVSSGEGENVENVGVIKEQSTFVVGDPRVPLGDLNVRSSA